MRPVKKDKGGAPVTYPYRLTSDYSTYNFNFGVENLDACYELYNAFVASYKQAFTTWTSLAKYANKQIVKPSKYADRVTIKTAVANQVSGIYGQTTIPLVVNLGRYCSYCEQPLDQAQVEHNCPKSQYPFFSLAWENFLLACAYCNGKSAKSDKPSRAYVVDKFLGNVQPAAEMDYYDTIASKYFWPNLWPSCYKDVWAKLEYWDATNSKWEGLDLSLSTAQGQGNFSFDLETKNCQADVWLDATDVTTTRCYVQVVLESSFSQGDRIIALCQLNNSNAQKQDTRVGRRTDVWFEVLKQGALLARFGKNQSDFDEIWKNTLTIVQAKGFYSVWVLILNYLKAQDPSGTLLVTRFINDTKDPKYFPNTDVSQIP